jgi:hypothetical protein
MRRGCIGVLVAMVAAIELATVVVPRAQVRSLPTFAVDASWPRLPAQWKLGDPSSFAIDAQDNIWLLHRPRTLSGADAPKAAPPVLVFDASGAFIKGWGGDGQFVLQIGKSNQSRGNADTMNVHRAADVWFHAPANEIFVADATATIASSCSTPTAARSSGCGARSAIGRSTTITARW